MAQPETIGDFIMMLRRQWKLIVLILVLYEFEDELPHLLGIHLLVETEQGADVLELLLGHLLECHSVQPLRA